ncbi:hypothetical protein BC939DRAFT_445676 [Gamsiella multidivaricata]|uniref:uncharacterized protein n=1 Tax=Gamsiella multidivaricata TaxID=101098 RepID=UPI002220F931|nr:uncharacterized protein BC939DRAFT_445676 [Gamsiella multidivaricata]KAI7827068.1 hypothetical protein BC939DRAFT_445676 [Gamsiella multidivaricata]
MSKKELCAALWGQIVQDAKVFAHQVLSKISSQHSVPPVYQYQHQYQPQQYYQHPDVNVSYTSTVSLVNITTASSTSLMSSHSGTEHYNMIQDMNMQYETLWEAQLALGEIPGMFEGNILQPCDAPCSSQQPSQSFEYQQYSSSRFASASSFSTNSFEEHIEHPFDRSVDNVDEKDGQRASQQRFMIEGNCSWSYSPLSDAPSAFQQDETTLEIAFPRPDGVTKNDLRHDRKDSGVFVHDDDEGIILHVSPKSTRAMFEFESDLCESEAEETYDYSHEEEVEEDKVSGKRILSLREQVMGDDLFLMENGSLLLSHSSLLATVSSLSLRT